MITYVHIIKKERGGRSKNKGQSRKSGEKTRKGKKYSRIGRRGNLLENFECHKAGSHRGEGKVDQGSGTEYGDDALPVTSITPTITGTTTDGREH